MLRIQYYVQPRCDGCNQIGTTISGTEMNYIVMRFAKLGWHVCRTHVVPDKWKILCPMCVKEKRRLNDGPET